jgi:hypothetical protein
MNMKCSIAKTFAMAAVAALALVTAPTAKAQFVNKGCSNATLIGTFAYTTTGFIVAAPIPALVGPSAEVGMQHFDGNGGVTFTFNSSQNGNIGPGTATGTYTVNSDCTGTFTEVTPMFTSHYSFVIDNVSTFVIDGGGVEFRAICQDTGVVVTRVGRGLYPGRDI